MRPSGGTRRRLLRYLTLVFVLMVGVVGVPSASATSAPVGSLALYPAEASVHPELNTAPPRLVGGRWILAPGTHFLYNDYVQIGKSRLIFQPDGNLVLYDDAGRARWASGTDHRGQEAIFQTDGNLVVYVSRGRPFSSKTCCRGDLALAVQEDGYIALYSVVNGSVPWIKPVT